MTGYEAFGRWHEVSLLPLNATASRGAPRAMTGTRALAAAEASAGHPNSDAEAVIQLISDTESLHDRVDDPGDLRVVQGRVSDRAAAAAGRTGRRPLSTAGAITLATQTVIAEGMGPSDLKAAKKFGAILIDEGSDGKLLLRVDDVERMFELVELLTRREVASVSPNFLRRVEHMRPSAPAAAWSHTKIGVRKAWEITKGRKDITIAVLDEGVDTTHPALRRAVVAERDFIGTKDMSAMPDSDDAHGTACAGIGVSRDAAYAGIAPCCSLIAARIGIGDGTGHWVFDDFATAQAIDWCWRQGADILSNSWGGGAPNDAISNAFSRARTRGRGGRGCLVVFAAGNHQEQIDFPGELVGYVTVGASNRADERKTRTSSDGETGWGSNYGETLTVLAPGVSIWTTDIVGPPGYDPSDYTKTFNGTSSATPAVAGAAALMMSVNRDLTGDAVRDLLIETAKKLDGQTTWTPELGWGRLDVAKAVAAARRAARPRTPSATKRRAESARTKVSKKAAPTKPAAGKSTSNR